jgi:transcription elongation factor
VRELYGDNSLTKSNDGWIFQRNEYNGGLLMLSVDLVELSTHNVHPTLEEVYLFRASQDRVVVNAAATLASTLKLRINDRVKVVVGELQGTSGCLTEIHGDGMVTIVADDEQVPPMKLLQWEICKSFIQGDFVRVLFGEHQGKEGFIVDLEGNSATIYHHVPLADTGNITHSEVYFRFY